MNSPTFSPNSFLNLLMNNQGGASYMGCKLNVAHYHKKIPFFCSVDIHFCNHCMKTHSHLLCGMKIRTLGQTNWQKNLAKSRHKIYKIAII